MNHRYIWLPALAVAVALGGPAMAAGDMKKDNTQTQAPGTQAPDTRAQSPATTSPNTPPASSADTAPGLNSSPTVGAVPADQLLGADVKNANNETIGEVESIYIDQNGKIQSVIVGVGGFLGLGQRDVEMNWNSLMVADGGDAVRTTLTKDQLKSMPEYKYPDRTYRGKVFSDSGVYQN
ncbi:PRC-barrel domain-containing protein [Ferrovibrio sp.]|uniref:PRC-barrel domain-containing protein n=1 Tax=Ferrovibrio sp. TaxID=1917215 RepID=UPI0026310B9F|nr:PRC-barrel domain-containing protein [Ferrovibrio sp.]